LRDSTVVTLNPLGVLRSGYTSAVVDGVGAVGGVKAPDPNLSITPQIFKVIKWSRS
jgi:hypothetical protein